MFVCETATAIDLGVCDREMILSMLAPLELGCLRWVAQGKSIYDIALLEGIEKSQVEAHLERAATALNATSISEAVEILSRSRRE